MADRRHAADKPAGIGMSGGQSWTEKWLKFDNSYFKVPEGPLASELLRLQTDSCLAEDSSFKKYFDNYAASQEDFFADCENEGRSAGRLRHREPGDVFPRVPSGTQFASMSIVCL